MPTQPVMFEHWTLRRKGVKVSETWQLLALSIWIWINLGKIDGNFNKTMLKFRMLFGRVPGHDLSEPCRNWEWKLFNWVCILSLCPMTCPDGLSTSWVTAILCWGHLQLVSDLMKPVFSVFLSWCPGDRTVCYHGHVILCFQKYCMPHLLQFIQLNLNQR